MRIEPESIDQRADFENFNINAYRRQAFSMYNGVLTEVQLTVHEDLIEEIFDKFGEKTKLYPQGEELHDSCFGSGESCVFPVGDRFNRKNKNI